MTFLSGWSKYIELTIAAADIDAALTGFPVPIRISTASGESDKDVSAVFDEIGANWKKVAFQVGGSSAECYAEMEMWDSTAENGLFWVKTDLADSDNVIRMYFDNTHADNDTYIKAVGDAVNVYKSSVIVNHTLSNDPSTGGACMIDSTGNSHDGTTVGSMTSGDLISGLMGKAIDFDGSNDAITIADNAAFDPGTGSFSICAVIKTSVAAYGHIFTCDNSSSGGGWIVRIDNTGKLNFTILNTARSYISLATSAAINNGAWRVIHCVRDAAAGKVRIYVDGVSAVTEISDGAYNVVGGSGAYPAIGKFGSANIQYFSGQIENVRYYNEALTAAWIAAEAKACADSLLTFSDVKYPPFESENVLKHNILTFFTPETVLKHNILLYFTPEFVLKNSLQIESEKIFKSSLIFDSEKSILNSILGKFYAEYFLKNAIQTESDKILKNSLIIESENILKSSLAMDNEKFFKNSLIFDTDFTLKNRIFLANELFFKHDFQIISEKIFKNSLESVGYKEVYLKNSICESVISEFILKNNISGIAYLNKEYYLLNRILNTPGQPGSGLTFGNFYFDKDHII